MPTQPKPAPKIASNVLDRFSLKGKVAVVTGASGPIGDAVAEAYAQAGATTVMVYVRNDAAVAKSKEYSEKYRVKVIAEKLDVRDHSATDAFIQKLIKDLGRIDIWVANAGIAQEAIKIIGEDPKTWEDIIATNYTSIIYQAALLGAYWQDAKKGNFIITASGAGTSNIRPTNQVVYNSSKAAARNLARSLAQEFKDFARVNAVSPGYMGDAQGAPEAEIENALNRQVLGRTGDYTELQGAYLYLASDASTFTTGADLICDGGYTL